MGDDEARRGAVVVRPPYENMDFVRQLLVYFEQTGHTFAPRHLGIDQNGNEQVSFVEGQTTTPAGLTVEQAESLGALLRSLHDATASSPLAGECEIVRHGDPGVQNAVFQGSAAIAYIDWEYAAPGRRLEELAELTWGLLEAGPRDEQAPLHAARIAALCRGYRGPPQSAVVAEAGRQISAASDRYSTGSAQAATHFAALQAFLDRHRALLGAD